MPVTSDFDLGVVVSFGYFIVSRSNDLTSNKETHSHLSSIASSHASACQAWSH
jgi:hypothetical protein